MCGLACRSTHVNTQYRSTVVVRGNTYTQGLIRTCEIHVNSDIHVELNTGGQRWSRVTPPLIHMLTGWYFKVFVYHIFLEVTVAAFTSNLPMVLNLWVTISVFDPTRAEAPAASQPACPPPTTTTSYLVAESAGGRAVAKMKRFLPSWTPCKQWLRSRSLLRSFATALAIIDIVARTAGTKDQTTDADWEDDFRCCQRRAGDTKHSYSFGHFYVLVLYDVDSQLSCAIK